MNLEVGLADWINALLAFSLSPVLSFFAKCTFIRYRAGLLPCLASPWRRDKIRVQIVYSGLEIGGSELCDKGKGEING